MEVEEAEQHNGNTMENGGGENVPELDDAPPPTIVQPSPVRTGLKLKSSVSEEVPEVPEVPEIPEQQEAVDTPMEQDLSQFTVMDEANGSDDDASHDKVQKTEETGGTEPVSEDELPTQAAKELLDTEAVSDDELPATKPPVPEEIPDAEEVSEDELPPEKKRGASKSGDVAEDGEKEKNKETSKESAKRKLPPDGEYDPSSPTSENESDETPAKKAAMGPPSTSPKKDAKAKALPELEKYWKAVKDDPADFTGWTYLLQYVDQENDVDAAREAYDAFLSHYPYCYGYWRKFADYEKKRGNKEKCEEVFDRGLQAIPLSVDLWIHYLNYCRAAHADEEDFLREQYERAIEACGMEFRSDRLWESYIKWETENKRFQHVTALYDRLLATPTQGYNTHFESFQDHVTNNPPNKVLSVDEFLTIRQEVLQLLKTYDQPAPVAVDDAAPPGEEAEAPPGEESEEVKAAKSDEETTALRERIIAIRRKIHKNTVNAVLARWNYEEGIKRPYFHVKPLERCQLKNWKEYLDYEIEQGDTKRTIVLFERCLIACALYEEFWIKFVKFLQTITEQDYNDKIRDVLRRACTIHHPKKPSLHLFWSEFEELQENYTKAAEVLTNIEKAVPGLLQISYRRINLERRRGNLDKVCELYEHYINTSKNRTIVNNVAIKYARFSWKIKGDLEKAISILQKALEKDKDATRLYLQLIVMEMERTPMNHDAVISVLDQYLSRDVEPEQKMMFAQRKLEFLEDFGTDIVVVQKAHDEFTNIMKQIKDKKKKSDPDGKGSGNSSLPPTSYPPPNYAQNGTFSAAPPPGGYQGTPPFPPTHGAPPGNYNQTYNQAYSQSGDYSNYQNWGYSQPGYSGYNQNWSGYYSY